MSRFVLPPLIHNSEGRLRRVGYELEYAGVDLETSVQFMSGLLGVPAEQTAPFRYELRHALGKFQVEVDAALLQKTGYRESLASMGIDIDDRWQRNINDLLEGLASIVVPYEIVTPPLPIDDMALVDDIVSGLRKRKARGTGESLLYAFGVHLNPEAASLDTDYLLRHLQAFALLYDWICRETRVDFSRRMSAYIKPYPAEYLRRLINPGYRPDRNTLIGDYLALVGSRNFALDMLPLFAHLDEEQVLRGAKEPELVKARPAFHYRLANSQVNIEDWEIASEWRYWVHIESLAHDRERLGRLCRDYVQRNQSSLFRQASSWAEHVHRVIS